MTTTSLSRSVWRKIGINRAAKFSHFINRWHTKLQLTRTHNYLSVEKICVQVVCENNLCICTHQGSTSLHPLFNAKTITSSKLNLLHIKIPHLFCMVCLSIVSPYICKAKDEQNFDAESYISGATFLVGILLQI